MGKKKRRQEQQPQPKPSPRQQAEPQRDPRAETIALALANATSADGRKRARAYIRECGSPVVAARDVFDAYAEAAERTDPRYAIACRAGCWFCCTLPVAVTVFEAAMVRSAVLKLSEDEQQAIWDRLQTHIATQDQALTASNGQRTPWRRRCPLLNDEGQCRVYEGRPLVCRSVLSLDADRCRRAFLEDDAGDPNVPYSLTNNAALAGVPQLMVTLNEANLDHYPSYELGSALYKLWTEPDSFLSWQQGERFAQNGFPRMVEGGDIFPTPEGMPIGPPKE